MWASVHLYSENGTQSAPLLSNLPVSDKTWFLILLWVCSWSWGPQVEAHVYRACLCLSHMSMWVLPWHFRLLTSFMLFPNLPHSLALYTKNGGWLVLLYPNIIYSYQLDQIFPRVIMHIPMLKDTTNMRTEFMTSYCMMRDDLWWCRMTPDDAHWHTMTEFNTRRECTTGDLLMNPS